MPVTIAYTLRNHFSTNPVAIEGIKQNNNEVRQIIMAGDKKSLFVKEHERIFIYVRTKLKYSETDVMF